LVTLKIALTPKQVTAASHVHARLSSWKATDYALDSLKERMPGFDERACLIKAAAINQLYGTNVFALTRMAAHVAEIMQSPSRTDLVEDLATLTTAGKQRRHLSFASKFAHFFVDGDRFPIFDSYAVQSLRYHLSGITLSTDNPPPYSAYVQALHALTDLAGLTCSGRELDRYLWLGGLYRTWLRNNGAPINVGVATLFEQADSEIAEELRVLAGTDPPNTT
jgi:hypothetical protein